MPKKEKILKVRLTEQVNSFWHENVRYKPGDEFEIPERLFRSDFMEKVVPPEKKPIVQEKPTEEKGPTEVPAVAEGTPLVEKIDEEPIVLEEKAEKKVRKK